MKYLVLYNSKSNKNLQDSRPDVEFTYKMPMGYESAQYSDTETVMMPFTTLEEALSCANKYKGFVVKLVEVEVKEKDV